jgi:hypothetical protein
MAWKPPSSSSNHPPRPVGSGLGLASSGSGRRTQRRVNLCRRWEGKGLGRNRDGMALTPISNDRGAVAGADEPGASVSVHYGLVRLKDAERAELQLQEFRAGDRVQSKRVHARKVRQESHSSFKARVGKIANAGCPIPATGPSCPALRGRSAARLRPTAPALEGSQPGQRNVGAQEAESAARRRKRGRKRLVQLPCRNGPTVTPFRRAVPRGDRPNEVYLQGRSGAGVEPT